MTLLSFCKADITASIATTFRKLASPALVVSGFALAGCATTFKPPDISYDDAAPAMLAGDPPKPVEIVEMPEAAAAARPVEAGAGQQAARRSRRTRSSALPRPMPPPVSNRCAMASSMPCRSIRSLPARSIRSMPRPAR